VRKFFWWGVGFSLYFCGILVMIINEYGVHRIFLMLTFAFVAASVTTFYYAASLTFFEKGSFFREKFWVIFFIVSFGLLLLPLFVLSNEYITSIIQSFTIVFGAAALLVIAVVFNHVVTKCSADPSVRRSGALHPVAWWTASVWGMCIVLFWGWIPVVGVVFVLSLFEFMLLLYDCTGGDNIEEQKPEEHIESEQEYREFCIQSINGVEYKIKRKIDIIQEKLNSAMQEIGVALLYTMRAEDETGRHLLYAQDEVKNGRFGTYTIKEASKSGSYLPRDPDKAKSNYEEQERKNKMVGYASTIGMKEDELLECIVKLMEHVFGLAKGAYRAPTPYRTSNGDPYYLDGGNEYPQTDGINTVPLDSACGAAGEEGEGMEPAVSVKLEKLAKYAFFRSSTDMDMIETCCELAIGVCDMENAAVTKIKWEKSPDDEHPRGMIGHTYNILRYYDEKIKDETYSHSQAFKEEFRIKANQCLDKANTLRESAFKCKVALQESSSDHTGDAIKFLKDAIDLLKNEVALFQDASHLIKTMLKNTC
jgi:hypothetical protein